MASLRFLADESCDFAVVRALRAVGYDVLAVGEFMQRSDDRELIELAFQEGRVLLTEDKDFGWLVFVSRENSTGVILIRYPSNLRRSLASAVVNLLKTQGEKISGAFIVLQPGRADQQITIRF
jgi:predicted nuclease of predicted toxin-antitoxin system